jgi:hypothetical protein
VQADGRLPGFTTSKTSQDSDITPLKNSPMKYSDASKSPLEKRRKGLIHSLIDEF